MALSPYPPVAGMGSAFLALQQSLADTLFEGTSVAAPRGRGDRPDAVWQVSQVIRFGDPAQNQHALGQDPFDPAYGHGLVNAVDKMQSIVGRRQGSLVEIIAETATIHEEAFRAWRHPSQASGKSSPGLTSCQTAT